MGTKSHFPVGIAPIIPPREGEIPLNLPAAKIDGEALFDRYIASGGEMTAELQAHMDFYSL